MSGSKTYYYVSSSTSPIFNRDKVVDQFQSAIIDQTTNSEIELSEYLKNHYRTSRLWSYRGYLNWCHKVNLYGVLGSYASAFYSNPEISNSVVEAVIKSRFTLGEKDTFGVNSADLDFFDVDYWLKYIATQQGVANKFASTSASYTVTYPTSTTVRATFKDGSIVEGALPTFNGNTRFIKISWSIDRVTEREYYPEDDKKDDSSSGSDSSGSSSNTDTPTTTAETTEEGSTDTSTDSGSTDSGSTDSGSTDTGTDTKKDPIIVIDHSYEYGYYVYQEGTGYPALDTLMVNNKITAQYTFYPVIPLRTDTAWLGEHQRKMAGAALKKMNVVKTGQSDDAAYWEICNACANGMTSGSMSDIDYITLIFGVNINTRDKASQRYLFEFFHNIYFNAALAYGEEPESLGKGHATYNGSARLSSASKKLKRLFHSHDNSRGFYRKFNINNSVSNLNLTYEWAGADYYENNGKWKKNAKPGDYGVLAGWYSYVWYTMEPKLDSEGNVVYAGNEYDGYHIVYEEVRHENNYNLTLFCKQESANRWKTVAFCDLNLSNLVYHGLTVDTDAYSAVKDSNRTEVVTQNFDDDYPPSEPDLDGTLRVLNFEYVENPGDSDSAFIVPIEANTFREIGVVNQCQISYICSYLIFNCWVKVKKKWYQRGFFSVFLSFVGFVVGCVVSYICPPLGWAMMAYFAVMFTMTFSAWALSTALKILKCIFGDSLGQRIYDFCRNYILGIIVAIVGRIPVIGWIIAAAIMFSVVSGETLNNGGSAWDAFKKGSIAGAMAAAGSYIGAAAGSATSSLGSFASGLIAAGASAAVQTFGNSLLSGESFGTSLKAGLKTGALAMAAYVVSYGMNTLAFKTGLSDTDPSAPKAATSNMSVKDIVTSGLMKCIVLNPMTYINLASMVQEERMQHKLQNLENDFVEFQDKYGSAMRIMSMLMAQSHNMYTAQETIKMQSCVGRLTTMFPEVNASMTLDYFLNLALTADHCKNTLGACTSFVDNKLSMDGYQASTLFFTQEDYTLVWDS